MFLYISYIYFSIKKLFKCHSLKRERTKKSLLQKLVRLGKGRAKMYSNYMMPKAYSSKKYQNFHGIDAQNLSCIDQKV